MARIRISGPAQADLAHILATSLDRWGADAQRRYAALLAGAIRAIVEAPHGPLTRDRAELRRGLRSLHLRHVRTQAAVDAPVHVVYYRVGRNDTIDVVRVLHERMEPRRQVTSRRRPR